MLQDLTFRMMRSFRMIDEEVHSVEEIRFANTRVGIEEDQVELGI